MENKEKKLFTDRRWTDPPAFKSLGKTDTSEPTKKYTPKQIENLRKAGFPVEMLRDEQIGEPDA